MPYKPHPPGRKKFWTAEKLMDGLTMAGGNVTEACRMLVQKYNHSIGRSTLYNAIRDSEEVREHFKQCQGITFDIAWNGVTVRSGAGNPRDQRLVVQRLGAAHGLPNTQRVEVTGADGQPVQHQHEVVADGEQSIRKRLSAVADDDLADLLKAVKVFNGTGTPGANSTSRSA